MHASILILIVTFRSLLVALCICIVAIGCILLTVAKDSSLFNRRLVATSEPAGQGSTIVLASY